MNDLDYRQPIEKTKTRRKARPLGHTRTTLSRRRLIDMSRFFDPNLDITDDCAVLVFHKDGTQSEILWDDMIVLSHKSYDKT